MSLTDKQQKILEFITQYSEENAYAPSRQEIATHFGFSSLGTVEDYLKALENGGYVLRSAGGRRNLTVIDRDRNLPLLGKVAAGRPIEYTIHDQTVEVPSSMIKSPFEHFALKVSGDSMVDIGIVDGDIVVVRKQPDAENGHVVIAMLNNEATIKRLQKKKNKVELISENPKYKPIVVEPIDDFRVVGVYAGLIRIN
jgi:repressor LexA